MVGYDNVNGDIRKSGDHDVSWKLAGGGFQSTVEDLTRYCAMLLGNELLSEENKKRGSYGRLLRGVAMVLDLIFMKMKE